MQDRETQAPPASKHHAWNKNKLIGAKPPLRPKHVWSIRTKLQIADRKRDLAMFNLAIDSKLRGCDVVALKVEDIAPHGYTVERATVRQKKTGVPVRFKVTEQTRQAVDDYIRTAGRKAGEFLFAAPRRPGRSLSTRQYARLRVPGNGSRCGFDGCSRGFGPANFPAGRAATPGGQWVRYRSKSRRTGHEARRLFLTLSVGSPPSIDALRKDHSYLTFAALMIGVQRAMSLFTNAARGCWPRFALP
jgi:integrase